MGYFAKYRYVAACICLALVLGGCDWVKGQMGMPTSEDIEKMKLELEQQELLAQQEAAREQRIRDSLKRVEELAAIPKVEGYYVVLGSFKDHRNAEALDKLRICQGSGAVDFSRIVVEISYLLIVGQACTQFIDLVKLTLGAALIKKGVWINNIVNAE